MKEVPSLDTLVIEYDLIKGGIELAKSRIKKQAKLPDYMFKTLSVITRAYILTALKDYPSDLKNQTEVLRIELDKLKNMFYNQ